MSTGSESSLTHKWKLQKFHIYDWNEEWLPLFTFNVCVDKDIAILGSPLAGLKFGGISAAASTGPQQQHGMK